MCAYMYIYVCIYVYVCVRVCVYVHACGSLKLMPGVILNSFPTLFTEAGSPNQIQSLRMWLVLLSACCGDPVSAF